MTKTWRDLKKRLKPFSIVGERMTSFRHYIAAAIAPVEKDHEEKIKDALLALGQDPEGVTCMVTGCENGDMTWDALKNLVEDKVPTGYGHTLGNVIPLCRSHNSSKGKKEWRGWFQNHAPDRVSVVEKYVQRFAPPPKKPRGTLFREYMSMASQVEELLKRLDKMAPRVRESIHGP